MDTPNEDIIQFVQYYQERLDRYAFNKNEDKMLYVIKKLNKLPINTTHLENTGVGRTVNALKKYEGKVGEAAKELVCLWKDMVLREENAAKENARVEPGEDVDSVYSSDHGADNLCVEENCGSKNIQVNSCSRGNHCDEYVEHVNKKRVNSDESKICSETEKEVEHQFAISSKEKSKKRYHSTECAEDRKKEKHKSKKKKKEHGYEEFKRQTISKPAGDKFKGESSNKIIDNEDIEKHEFENSLKHISDECSKFNLEKQEKGGKNIDEKSRQRLDTNELTKSHSRSEKRDKRREKDKSDSKNVILIKSEKTGKSHYREKNTGSKKASDYGECSPDSKCESSKEKDREQKNHKKSKITKSAYKGKIVNGIDSESGASFAEALGMCGPKTVTPSAKKKPVSFMTSDKDRNSLNLETDKFADKSSTRSCTASSSHLKSESVLHEKVPDLLREKELEPLNINISSLLPEITPNYRPLGISLDHQPKRVMTDDEALSRVMSNRNQRTKVYSGNKSFGKVESLFLICVRILQDNIDALEYTGGVPYTILKPILERATPDQLFNMEHHNPYLIEDSDELWLLHCQKEFRNKKREELESWRDMYMRCLDEREARLNAITANIKQSQDKSIPIRTTKLAYIDSIVKPPRNIARQQAKNGMLFDKKHITTTAKLSALAKAGEAGKIAVPNPGSRAGERSSSTAAVKPKKAPLMAKTLSFLKNRFKR